MTQVYGKVALIGLGLNSAVVAYCLAQAYRLSDAATVAPFEYVGLPMAVLWGWLFWAELPALPIWIGIARGGVLSIPRHS